VPFNRLFLFAFRVAIILAAISFSFGVAEGAEDRAGEMLAMNNHLSTSFLDTVPAVLPAIESSRPADDALALTADTDLPQRNLWQRIRSGYALPELDSPLVARHEH